MEISRDLEMEIANNTTSIKSIDVTYKNGETISGFATKVKFMPFEVVLCKHETRKGEDSNHYLDFRNAESIDLVFHNGQTKSYN
jgi:hypothetical protein